jgi:hypothetical protein
MLLLLAVEAGCAQQHAVSTETKCPPRVIVVAPVLNLSGSQDFDALKVTDLVASEFLSFPDVAVVPVNLTLAELERHGKRTVQTPADALELARVLGADATVVTAITEYNPYAPPVVGMVMQWYDVRDATKGSGAGAGVGENPEASSQLSDSSVAPRWQVQRVFNAADEELCAQIRDYAARRDGDRSPYAWRKYVQSQEHYVRYCSYALIRAILKLDTNNRVAKEPNEARS